MNQLTFSHANSVPEALQLGALTQATKYLGGGTNLVDLMRYGVETPDQLVDITRLKLTEIKQLPHGGLMIGALVRNSDLAADPHVVRNYPVLSQALLNGASPQLRNMATTGGNLLQRTRCSYFYDTAFPCNKREPGTGCPAVEGFNRMHAIVGGSSACIAVHPSDMAVAMALLDAVVHVQGKAATRTIRLADFHRLPGDRPDRETELLSGELITGVELPASLVANHSTYVKVRDRASYAFALVSVAAALQTTDGKIASAKFALGGIAPKPWRVPEAEALLTGQPPTAESFRAAAERALEGAKGSGHNDFKIELAKRTVVRAFTQLTEAVK